MNPIDYVLRQKLAVKILVLVLILGAILGVYWQVFYRPVVAEINAIEPELNKLKAELSAKRDIVKEKPRYQAEVEQTRAELHLALKQLPNMSEIPTLLENISELGMSAGLMTATPSDASVDEMVAGDLATARAFGARVAETAARLA